MTSYTALVLGVGLLAFATPLWFLSPLVWRAWRRHLVRRELHRDHDLIDRLNASTEARRRQLNAIVAPPVSPQWLQEYEHRAGNQDGYRRRH
jgi:hypothetical protein